MLRIARTLTRVTAENLEPFPMIRYGFFGRSGGVSLGVYESLNVNPASQDDSVHIDENLRRVAHEMVVRPPHLLTCQQVHGAHVVKVTTPWDRDKRPQADAMVTQFEGLALGILTADCAPLLFADNKAGVIGAAHAGWKGAVGGVIEATVRAMEGLGSQRENIHAAIGPCIGKDSYEVSQEFLAPFLAQDEGNISLFGNIPHKIGYYTFDFPAYVLACVKKCGVATVSPSAFDTCAEEKKFFSYRRATLRREAETGRQISCIMLAD